MAETLDRPGEYFFQQFTAVFFVMGDFFYFVYNIQFNSRQFGRFPVYLALFGFKGISRYLFLSSWVFPNQNEAASVRNFYGISPYASFDDVTRKQQDTRKLKQIKTTCFAQCGGDDKRRESKREGKKGKEQIEKRKLHKKEYDKSKKSWTL